MEHQTDITGYYPGVIGHITALHAMYYKTHWGLDHTFEAEVAKEIAEFILNFDPKKDGLWSVVLGERLAGCIAIVGDRHHPEQARLRWYIVDVPFQKQGIGTRLIEKAILFCKDAGFDRIILWTFEGLEQARAVYERKGFTLTRTREVPQWGGMIKEHRLDLVLSRDRVDDPVKAM